MMTDSKDFPEATMRNIAKELAGKDREHKSQLVARRRRVGLTQAAIDEAYGFPEGTTKALEAYDSDPTLSELRRYEAFIMLTELQEGARALREQLSLSEEG